ncbi:hypothetical protein M1N24_00885 [Dehalococcoidia bacterium]|nr:hypothetical protein [Dehalococcoidia bacterium]
MARYTNVTKAGRLYLKVKDQNHIPAFVPVVAIALGCYDLLRGFIHTIALEYAALSIAGLDLGGVTAIDQLKLMATLGMSNFVSGIALIIIGLSTRRGALIMLAVIPVSYLIGIVCFRFYSASHEISQANWGGATPLMAYLGICAITFISGLVMATHERPRREG